MQYVQILLPLVALIMQIFSITHKETNESSPEDTWNVNTNKYPQAAVTLPNKITPEDLANEMLWLRLDQNYLMTEKEAMNKVLFLIA